MFVKMARSVGLPVLGDDIREVRFEMTSKITKTSSIR